MVHTPMTRYPKQTLLSFGSSKKLAMRVISYDEIREKAPKFYYFPAPVGNDQNPRYVFETAVNAYAYFCLIHSSAKEKLRKDQIYKTACTIIKQLSNTTQKISFRELCFTVTQYDKKFQLFVPDGEVFSLSAEAIENLRSNITTAKRKGAFKQQEIASQLEDISIKLDKLSEQNHVESAAENSMQQEQLIKEQHAAKLQLRLLKMNVLRVKKTREKKKKLGMKQLQSKRGRPEIYKNIAAITIKKAEEYATAIAAHERRRNDNLYVPGTGAEIRRAVQATVTKEVGCTPSDSTCYIKGFIPRNKNTREGKRHAPEAKVKTVRQTDDGTKDHEDQHYCAAYQKYFYSAYLLTKNNAMFIGEDKKANVPMHGNAVSKSSTGAIHINDRAKVARNDHNFGCVHGDTIAPNVVGFFTPGSNIDTDVRPNQGPVFVTLRDNETHSTGKFENAVDLLHAVEKGGHFSHLQDGSIRPILYRQTDNANDVAPHNRLGHVMSWFIFRVLNLDAYYHGSYAPGHSKYAVCEHTMSHLTKPLGSVHDLDEQLAGKHRKQDGSIIQSVYKKNAILVLNKLRGIFARVQVKDFTVQCDVIPPAASEYLPHLNEFPTSLWDKFEKYFEHKRSELAVESVVQIESILHKIDVHSTKGNGLYVFGLVKCNDLTCCSERRAPELMSLLQQFDTMIPAPIPDVNRPGHFMKFMNRIQVNGIELDSHCPSVMKDIHTKQCEKCQRMCHSKTELMEHIRIRHPSVQQQINKNRRKDQVAGEASKLVQVQQTKTMKSLSRHFIEDIEKTQLRKRTKKVRTVQGADEMKQ
jgi:hypothetical protein